MARCNPATCQPHGIQTIWGAPGPEAAPSPRIKNYLGEPEQVEKQLFGLRSHAAGVAMGRKAVLDLNFSTLMLQLAY